MLLLIASIVIAAVVRLLMYYQAEHCLHEKNITIEQLK